MTTSQIQTSDHKHAIAVIHYSDDALAMTNADIVLNAGFDGVALIDMDGGTHTVDKVSQAIKRAYPNALVGANRLSSGMAEAINIDIDLGLDFTWHDSHVVQAGALTEVGREALHALPGDHTLFAAIAFKGQPRDADVEASAKAVKQTGWVATTSGPATGSAPHLAKLEILKKALGDAPLAVASGLTPENIGMLAAHVDWCLVATGISRSFYAFDEDKAKAFIAALRQP